VSPAPRPQWQQATALITLGASGIVTGLSFVPKAPADLTSPASLPPVKLLALDHASGPALGTDAMLRAAIVHIARHFMNLAQTRSPAEMEAMIWQYASTDGANHGPSCAAFASLTLELGSHIAGLDSWVTGGTSYPWPVHSWVDGRVDPNPASPNVVSVLQDAQSHGRWRPLGDGYAPKPGDWVLFDGHVEVVTKYQGGVLHTIGGDSLPNLSVNAHEYADPLQGQGVAGFVDNGVGMSKAPASAAHTGSGGGHGRRVGAAPRSPASAPALPGEPALPANPASPGNPAPLGGPASPGDPASAADPAASGGPVSTADAMRQQPELAPRAIPVPPTVPRSRYTPLSRALPAQGALPLHGARPAPAGGHASGAGAAPGTDQAAPVAPQPGRSPVEPSPGHAAHRAGQRSRHAGQSRAASADVPATGLRPARPQRARPGEAAIPGLLKSTHRHHAGDVSALPPYHRHDLPRNGVRMPGTATQQAFINEIASGAMATQRKYGVPASVTIAQAIDESGWGQSVLAASDHNLFGIKGTGPAGSDEQPTQEVINGQVVNLSASFQVYQDISQSIDAHGRLLARSGDYASAMSKSRDPNAFAAALTGVYATDPEYGAKLVQLMEHYNLYRFDRGASRGDASGTVNAGTPPGQGAGVRPGSRQPGPHAVHDASHSAGPSGAQQPGGRPRPTRPRLPKPAPDPRQPSPGRDRAPGSQHPGPIGNPVPVPPGLMVGPASPARDATPAEAWLPGTGLTTHQPGTPRSRQPVDRPPVGQHEGATNQAGTAYPGRSARPAPLAHPARPTDLAPTSSATPPPGAGRLADPPPRPGRSQAGAAYGQPAGHTSPDAGTAPGVANMSADAAIPGVPDAVAPRTGHAHARRAGSRPLPPHAVVRPARPAIRAYHAGPATAGEAARPGADMQHPTAPTAPTAPPQYPSPSPSPSQARTPRNTSTPAEHVSPSQAQAPRNTAAPAAHASPGSARTPRNTAAPAEQAIQSSAQTPRSPAAPAGRASRSQARTPRNTSAPAAAPIGGRAGGAVIPGLEQLAAGAYYAPGLPRGGTAASDNGEAVTAQPGGSSIPGAHMAATAGSAVRPGAPASTAAASAGRAPARASKAPAPPSTSSARTSKPPASARNAPATTLPSPAAPSAPASTPPAPARTPSASVGTRPVPARTSPARASTPSARASTPPAPAPLRAPTSTAPALPPANTPPAPAPAPAPAPPPAPAGTPPTAAKPWPTAASVPQQGGADVPGLTHGTPTMAPAGPGGSMATSATSAAMEGGLSPAPGGSPASGSAPGGAAAATLTVYRAHMPPAVREAFVTSAKMPLTRAQPLYLDVASHTGIRWEILAACDWMQCKARHKYSPVYGEKLGALNPDDTCYRTKSAALEQCASDLVQLARSVYRLDIATSQELTVQDLAKVFAAFRWGGLLRQHNTSAMDFPYSVAGLSVDHTHMRWPNIDDPNAPDKPGSRFRQPFGAVPVVLGLNYQALI
jgi:flagellum-specific peptidoglycan hydrolase FlgJ